MASVNKVILVGNIGRDPESRTFPSGDMVVNASLATTYRWKDKQTGEMKEATEWHRLVFNARLAEIANQYVRKGSQIYIEGSLRTRKWTDQAGVEKYSTEIRVDQLQLLGSRGDSQQGGDGGQQQRAPAPAPRQAPAPASRPAAPAPAGGGGSSGFSDMDDDIPFASPFMEHDTMTGARKSRRIGFAR